VKAIKRVWEAVFNFFCGDYFVFIGVAVTIILTWCLERVAVWRVLRPVSGAVLVAGIVLSFSWAVSRSLRK